MTCSVIKEAIGKNSSWQQKFPNKVNLGSKFITSTDSIAGNFCKYFTEIGPNLANKISTPLTSFDTYLSKRCYIFQPEIALSINELKDAFYSLKTSESPGYGGISSNIIKQCFGTLNRPLYYIYNISLQAGVFPEEMKVARVTLIFKGGEVSDLETYRPISILCYFSKILEKILFNRLYKHLLNNNILYKKQFRFQENHSTDHAIIQLVDQISNSFEKNDFTLSVFMVLRKASGTVDHVILIKKLDHYVVKGSNFLWFKSYLNNRSQFITHNNSNTSFANILCGVTQGSILGPFLFLLYMNDLPKTSRSYNVWRQHKFILFQ